MGEIRRAQSALEGCGALVLPLHGDLPPAEQDRALRPADGRRVVLATSIAETSLTVPGVRVVVDGGWRRAPRLDPATGLMRLATLRISRAAADQRAGRAGREAPGHAIRLWTTALHRGMPAFDRPEILEAELSGLRLDCAAWGAAPADLPFPDPPPPGALAAADALLGELGALADGRITDLGRRMARLGAHPRLAAMMLAADDDRSAALAATLAALLEERDPLRAPDAPATSACASPCSRARRWACIRMRDRGAVARIRQRGGAVPHSTAHSRERARGRRSRAADRGRLSRPHRPASGRAGQLPACGRRRRAAAVDRSARARVAARGREPGDEGRRAHQVSPPRSIPRRLPASLAARVTETVETTFDATSGAVLARRRRRLGTLVLEDRTERADPGDTAAALAQALTLDALPWSDAARQFQARVALMRSVGAGCRLARSRPIRRSRADICGVARAASARPFAAGRRRPARSGGDPARAARVGAGGAAGSRSADASHAAGRARRDRLHPAGADRGGTRAVLLSDWQRRRASPAAVRNCGSRCSRPRGGRSRSPPTCPGSGAVRWADVRKDMRGRYPQAPLA